MSERCTQGIEFEELDELVFGGISSIKRARTTRHAAECAACEHELAWLRAERRLFNERAQREPLSPPSLESFTRYRELHQDQAAESQVPSGNQQIRRRWLPVASAAAAAALLLLLINGRQARFPVEASATGGQPPAPLATEEYLPAVAAEVSPARSGFTPAVYTDSIEICESRQPAPPSASFEHAGWSEDHTHTPPGADTSAAGFTSDELSSCVAHPSGSICDSGS